MTNEPKKTTLGWVATPRPGQPQPMPDWYTQQQQFYAQQAQQPDAYAPTVMTTVEQAYGHGHSQQPQDGGLAGLIARGTYEQQPDYAQHPHHAQAPYDPQPQYAQPQYAQQAPYPQAPYPQAPYPQAPYPQPAPFPQPEPPPYPIYQAPAPPAGNGTAIGAGTPASKRAIANADATTGPSQRRRFIRLTYLHLLGAILAFAGLSYVFQTNAFLVEHVSAPFFAFAVKTRYNWGIVLAAFMGISWVADRWASHAKSRGMQYVGLALYVLAEALIFVPLLVLVELETASILTRGGAEPHILRDSAVVTLGIFGALTASVVVTKKDFSFLRSGLMMAGGAALTLIACSIVFGFSLGLVFSVAMVMLAAGYILYQTSQVLAHYDPESHVAAALALFSSVALMFWYVIRIFMRMRD